MQSCRERTHPLEPVLRCMKMQLLIWPIWHGIPLRNLPKRGNLWGRWIDSCLGLGGEVGVQLLLPRGCCCPMAGLLLPLS